MLCARPELGGGEGKEKQKTFFKKKKKHEIEACRKRYIVKKYRKNRVLGPCDSKTADGTGGKGVRRPGGPVLSACSKSRRLLGNASLRGDSGKTKTVQPQSRQAEDNMASSHIS